MLCVRLFLDQRCISDWVASTHGKCVVTPRWWECCIASYTQLQVNKKKCTGLLTQNTFRIYSYHKVFLYTLDTFGASYRDCDCDTFSDSRTCLQISLRIDRLCYALTNLIALAQTELQLRNFTLTQMDFATVMAS